MGLQALIKETEKYSVVLEKRTKEMRGGRIASIIGCKDERGDRF